MIQYKKGKRVKMYKISKEWDSVLESEFSSTEYLKLREFLKKEYSSFDVFPGMIFSTV